MLYDRADRSLGTAFVTYDDPRDAREAVRQFDGANANGQPIRLSLLPSGHSRDAPVSGGSLFDRVQYPARSLEDRISRDDDMPRRRGGRQERSFSPRKDRGGLRAPADVDRYVPGGRGGRDSRSPLPGGGRPREGGRRPGERRERGGRGGGRGGRVDDEGRPAGGGRRPKKTAEELDAEMEDYFGGGGGGAATNGGGAAASGGEHGGGASAGAAGGNDDVDMIE